MSGITVTTKTYDGETSWKLEKGDAEIFFETTRAEVCIHVGGEYDRLYLKAPELQILIDLLKQARTEIEGEG